MGHLLKSFYIWWNWPNWHQSSLKENKDWQRKTYGFKCFLHYVIFKVRLDVHCQGNKVAFILYFCEGKHQCTFNLSQKNTTRMHSSRMHNVRYSDRPGGGVCLGGCLPRRGQCLPGGCLPRGVCTPTPVNRITDKYKNITFPQLRLRMVT